MFRCLECEELTRKHKGHRDKDHLRLSLLCKLKGILILLLIKLAQFGRKLCQAKERDQLLRQNQKEALEIDLVRRVGHNEKGKHKLEQGQMKMMI